MFLLKHCSVKFQYFKIFPYNAEKTHFQEMHSFLFLFPSLQLYMAVSFSIFSVIQKVMCMLQGRQRLSYTKKHHLDFRKYRVHFSDTVVSSVPEAAGILSTSVFYMQIFLLNILSHNHCHIITDVSKSIEGFIRNLFSHFRESHWKGTWEVAVVLHVTDSLFIQQFLC